MKFVLIVDDSKEYAESVQAVLHKNDFSADIALDADACGKAVENNNYDLIIMDINIYDVDGRQLVLDLHEKYGEKLKNNAFIFASNRKALINANICEHIIGVSDYIIKPFTSEELLEAISQALSRKQS